jgi:hypothetical protein
MSPVPQVSAQQITNWIMSKIARDDSFLYSNKLNMIPYILQSFPIGTRPLVTFPFFLGA